MAKITLLVLVFCVIFILLELSEARRGGGGRFGVRSRSFRASRVRYVRNTRSVRVSSGFRSKFGGYRLGSKSAVRNAILIGAVYGALRYRRKRPRFGYDDDDNMPTVCYNDRYDQNTYGNVSYYGRFICPDNYQEDNNYCCGDEGRQFCCNFWDDGGRVAGVVIGIIIFIGIIAVILYCCCCRRRNQKPPSSANSYGNRYEQSKPQNGYTEQSVPLTNNPGGYYTPAAPQPYPNAYPPEPYNTAPPPPSYDAVTGDGKLPYEVSPGNQQGGGYPPYPSTNYGVPQQTPPYPGTEPYPSAPYPTSNPPYPNQ